MKALKNMEAIFLIAATLAAVTSFATASTPTVTVAAERASVIAADSSQMPVVVVSAKRLTAAEKAALI